MNKLDNKFKKFEDRIGHNLSVIFSKLENLKTSSEMIKKEIQEIRDKFIQPSPNTLGQSESTPAKKRKYTMAATSNLDSTIVVRYARNINEEDDSISNLGGAVFICVLNHALNTLTIYPAVCLPNENFSKDEGMRIARVRMDAKTGITMPLKRKLPLLENIWYCIFHKETLDDSRVLKIEEKIFNLLTDYLGPIVCKKLKQF